MPMFLAVAEATAERQRWTTQDELIASLIEVVHSLLRVTVMANGGKAPKALTIPRPGAENTHDDMPVMTPAQLFAAAKS